MWWLTLSGTLTQRPSSWRGWKTRPWSRRLFGAATSQSWTPPHFSEWTWSVPAFPVPPSPAPGSARDLTMSGGSGPTSPRSSSPSVRDSSSSRTSQGLRLGDDGVPPGWVAKRDAGMWTRPAMTLFGSRRSEQFSGRWPTSGSLRNGYVSARPSSAPRMSGSGFSSWPTPKANDSEKRGAVAASDQTGLPGAARLWPTPTADRVGQRLDVTFSGDGRTTPNKLGWAVAMWPTPRASANENRITHDAPTHGRSHGRALAGAAGMWFTPTSAEGSSGPGNHTTRGRASNLRTQIAGWPTPRAADDGGTTGFGLACSGLPDGTTSTDGGQSSPSTRALNPRFAEMLMGWPVGWTDCTRSATEPYRSWLATHSSALADALGCGDQP